MVRSPFSVTVRVRYGDTDRMGVVYHGNYLTYFEVGRTEYLRALGFPYSRLEGEGILLTVVEAHCRYLAAATYDDLLRVETTGRTVSPVRVRFDYRIFHEGSGRIVAEGWTELVCLDRDRRPRRLPAEIRGVLGAEAVPSRR